MKNFKEFITESESLNESSLSRLWAKYKQFDSGTITAFRGERSKSENMKLNAELKATLIGGNFSVTSIDGVYIENYGSSNEKRVAEKSFIVFDYKNKGNLKKVLMTLGEKYDQDSITYESAKDGIYYLIGTSKREDSYPGWHNELKLGKPMFGDKGEFHSSIKGRPFVFKKTVDEDYHSFDDSIIKYNTPHKQILRHTFNESMEIE